VRARCEREGVAHLCPECKGDGHIWSSKEAETMCDNWKKSEPPLGDGYQLWETTSEGS
jgi:hypothetical protein